MNTYKYLIIIIVYLTIYYTLKFIKSNYLRRSLKTSNINTQPFTEPTKPITIVDEFYTSGSVNSDDVLGWFKECKWGKMYKYIQENIGIIVNILQVKIMEDYYETVCLILDQNSQSTKIVRCKFNKDLDISKIDFVTPKADFMNKEIIDKFIKVENDNNDYKIPHLQFSKYNQFSIDNYILNNKDTEWCFNIKKEKSSWSDDTKYEKLFKNPETFLNRDMSDPSDTVEICIDPQTGEEY